MACPVPALALLLLACGPEEPVLGLPPDPLLAGATEAPAADPDDTRTYARPAGVTVDVRYLGGKPVAEVRDLLSDQLGPLGATHALATGDGEELSFARGTVRVQDGRVYMIRIPLDPPLRRTDALVATGFPPQADRYVVLHREYRLNNAWGFRRLRMKRASPESELVTELEAWSAVPGQADPPPPPSPG